MLRRRASGRRWRRGRRPWCRGTRRRRRRRGWPRRTASLRWTRRSTGGDAPQDRLRLGAHDTQVGSCGLVDDAAVDADPAAHPVEQRQVPGGHAEDVALPEHLAAVVDGDLVAAVLTPVRVPGVDLALQHGEMFDLEYAVALGDSAG